MKRATEAFVSSDLFELGIGHVIVSRFKNDGRVEAGGFLVDVYCLGVKDAFFLQLDSIAEYESVSKEFFPSSPKAIAPETGRKLVESAVAYAAQLGFAPARDYKKACRVFGGIDASRCTDSFTFGQGGKPCYVAGPYESGAQQERILRILEAKCGPDNFGFVPDADEGEIEEPPSVLTEADRHRLLVAVNQLTEKELTLTNDGPKISERLLNLAEPFLHLAMGPEATNALALATLVAWNLARNSSADLAEKLQELHDRTPEELRSIVDAMVARKKELYPKDNRFVIEAHIVNSPTGAPVFVAAALHGKDELVD